MKRVRTTSSIVAVIIAMFVGLLAAQPAEAAYPTGLVAVGANVRACTNTVNCYPFGQVANDGSWSSSYQLSYVKCYQDGSWATGAYSSNRWFNVYVTLTNGQTVWGFVHSSYVDNQPTVGAC